MHRRAFLASAAGLTVLGGCIESSSDSTAPPEESPIDSPDPTTTPTPTRTPTETPTPTPTPTDGSDSTPADDGTPAGDVTVSSVTLQTGVVVTTSPDSIGVAHGDAQFLIASISVEGSLERADFALAVGDERYDPTTVGDFYRTKWGDDRWYDREGGEGLVLFQVPGRAGDGDLRLTWPGGERAIESSIAERLGAGPASFSASLDLPAEHGGAEAPPVRIEVTNGGGIERRFVAALNRIGPRIAHAPIERLSEPVPAGETVTLTVEDSWMGLPDDERIGDGEPDVTYLLSYPGGEDSAEIRLVESA